VSRMTVYTLLETAATKFGDQPALHQPLPQKGKGYQVTTWNQYAQMVRELACGLFRLGVRRGEIVALQSETRAEFYFADMAVMSAGAIAAALYTTYPAAEQVATLRNTTARFAFIENPKLLAAIGAAAAADQPLPIRFILLTGEAAGVMTLAQLRQMGKEALQEDPQLFARLYADTKPEDPAILYLTSGATGQPKMGLVSHGAMCANVHAAPAVLPLDNHDRTIAFLPSAHITQRLVIQLLPPVYGMPVWFSEGISKLAGEIRNVKPTMILAPPRVWERIYSTVLTEIKKRPSYAQKLFYGALGLSLRASEYKRRGEAVPGWMRRLLALADKVVFTKIRERLGGELKVGISGAAPLARELAQFYAAIGITLAEGYGLTEGGVTHVNPLDNPMPGSIGKPLAGVRCRISPEGELLLAGPTLFSGYYKDEAATNAVLQDGWLRTGDLAAVDEKGFYSITGRIKEVLVASNGKKVYPNRVEGFFAGEPWLNMMMLVGDNRPYCTALFTINAAAAELMDGMEAWRGKPAEEIIKAPELNTLVQKAVKRVNQKLADYEQVRRFVILDKDFTIEAGELTPSMKLRKSNILKTRKDAIAELYVGKEELQ
jgi:long-chain acyl-CoA synthetase